MQRVALGSRFSVSTLQRVLSQDLDLTFTKLLQWFSRWDTTRSVRGALVIAATGTNYDWRVTNVVTPGELSIVNTSSASERAREMPRSRGKMPDASFPLLNTDKNSASNVARTNLISLISKSSKRVILQRSSFDQQQARIKSSRRIERIAATTQICLSWRPRARILEWNSANLGTES